MKPINSSISRAYVPRRRRPRRPPAWLQYIGDHGETFVLLGILTVAILGMFYLCMTVTFLAIDTWMES